MLGYSSCVFHTFSHPVILFMSNIIDIENRNIRVEMDKAWELSLTRRVLIAMITYLVVGGYLSFLKVEGVWFHAAVPAIAYFLSTLCLSKIKIIWIEKVYKAKEVKS